MEALFATATRTRIRDSNSLIMGFWSTSIVCSGVKKRLQIRLVTRKTSSQRKLIDFPYEPLKFILGYYANGACVKYVAIMHRDGCDPPIATQPLFGHDLRLKADRLGNIVHLIRLCGALLWMSEQLPRLTNPEYTTIERPSGVELTMGPVVKKLFKQRDGGDHVIHLKGIYALLKEKKVPNTDDVTWMSLGPRYPYILIKPVGRDRIPCTGVELFQAANVSFKHSKRCMQGPTQFTIVTSGNQIFSKDVVERNGS